MVSVLIQLEQSVDDVAHCGKKIREQEEEIKELTEEVKDLRKSTEAKEDKTRVVETPSMSAVADMSEEDLESIYHDDNADKQEEVECLTCILSYLFFPKL